MGKNKYTMTKILTIFDMKKWLSKKIFPKDLFNRIRPGVIHIEFLTDNVVIGSGSGFISNGYLITNNHVYIAPK